MRSLQPGNFCLACLPEAVLERAFGFLRLRRAYTTGGALSRLIQYMAHTKIKAWNRTEPPSETPKITLKHKPVSPPYRFSFLFGTEHSRVHVPHSASLLLWLPLDLYVSYIKRKARLPWLKMDLKACSKRNVNQQFGASLVWIIKYGNMFSWIGKLIYGEKFKINRSEEKPLMGEESSARQSSIQCDP